MHAALPRYSLALLRDWSEVDELVQDTLVRAIGWIEARSGEGNIRVWLFALMVSPSVSRWRVRCSSPAGDQ